MSSQSQVKLENQGSGQVKVKSSWENPRSTNVWS